MIKLMCKGLFILAFYSFIQLVVDEIKSLSLDSGCVGMIVHRRMSMGKFRKP